MKRQPVSFYILPILLVLLGVFARLLPHPANVAPIAAIALFGSLYLPRRLALILPLVAVFLSDLIIGFYSIPIMIVVYSSFLLTGAIGLWIRKHITFAHIVGGTLIASTLFFLTTNAAVWAFGTMYPKTIAGLFESYQNAIPFFRNSVIGDLFFVGILVGAKEAVSRLYINKTKEAKNIAS